MTRLAVHQRIEHPLAENYGIATVSSKFGTVRWLGQLNGDISKQLWVGIEWDDETFGRHNGNFNGRQYFEQKRATPEKNCSTFIKLSTLPQRCLGIDFLQAVAQRYTEPITEEEREGLKIEDSLTGRTKAIEFPGMAAVEKFFGNIHRLRVLTLSGTRVSTAGNIGNTKLCDVESVYLDQTLLWRWADVIQIIQSLPNVRRVILNGTEFVFDDDLTEMCEVHSVDNFSIPQVKELYLNNTRFKMFNIKIIGKAFPNLETLSLCSNQILEIPADVAWNLCKDIFLHLHTLKLDQNHLTDWISISQCFGLANLRRLQLSENGLSDITDAKCLHSGMDLESLSIDDNQITKWESISLIAEYFDKLTAFRCLGNPITSRTNHSDACGLTTRYIIVALFPNLRNLNGGEISSAERITAERYFLSLLDRSDSAAVAVDRCGAIRKRLESIHGPLESVSKSADEIGAHRLSSRFVLLTVEADVAYTAAQKVITKKVPDSLSVSNLKMFCYRFFGIPPLKQRLICMNGQNESFVLDDIHELSYYGLDDKVYIKVQDGMETKQ